MSDARTIDHQLSEWDACDEHETVFRKGEPCWVCVGEAMAAQEPVFFFTNHPDPDS